MTSERHLILAISLVIVASFEMASSTGMLVGAFGGEKLATARVQEIADSVRVDVIKKWEELCKKENVTPCPTFDNYEAVKYKSQVVAGTNYIIKVQVRNNDFIVIKVFEPLPNEKEPLELKGVVPYESGEIGYNLFH